MPICQQSEEPVRRTPGKQLFPAALNTDQHPTLYLPLHFCKSLIITGLPFTLSCTHLAPTFIANLPQPHFSIDSTFKFMHFFQAHFLSFLLLFVF